MTTIEFDFDHTLLDLRKQPLLDGASKVPLTLGAACAYALTNAQAGDVSGREHIQRFMLGVKVLSGKASLTPEEIVLIKDRVAKAYVAPIIGGQVLMLLGET
jgi:hypothetical protein